MNNWSPTLRPPNMYIKCICWHFFFCWFVHVVYLFIFIYLLFIFTHFFSTCDFSIFFFFCYLHWIVTFNYFFLTKPSFFFLFLPKGLREAALVLDLPTLHQISAFWLYFWLFFILLHFKLTFIYYHHWFIILFKICNNFYQ